MLVVKCAVVLDILGFGCNARYRGNLAHGADAIAEAVRQQSEGAATALHRPKLDLLPRCDARRRRLAQARRAALTRPARLD